MTAASANIENKIQGTWWLLSREDHTSDGQRKLDPIFGSDPIAILVYANNYFAAQFMKREGSDGSVSAPNAAGQNNTSAVGGYDAYFVTYQVNEETKQVAHTLVGSINPGNIGMTVYRNLLVEGDKLTIKLETTTQDGEPVIRTLMWKRIA